MSNPEINKKNTVESSKETCIRDFRKKNKQVSLRTYQVWPVLSLQFLRVRLEKAGCFMA